MELSAKWMFHILTFCGIMQMAISGRAIPEEVQLRAIVDAINSMDSPDSPWPWDSSQIISKAVNSRGHASSIPSPKGTQDGVAAEVNSTREVEPSKSASTDYAPQGALLNTSGADQLERTPPYYMLETKRGNVIPSCETGAHGITDDFCGDQAVEFTNGLSPEDNQAIERVQKSPDDKCLPVPKTPLPQAVCAALDVEKDDFNPDGGQITYMDYNCHDYYCGLPQGHADAENTYKLVFCDDRGPDSKECKAKKLAKAATKVSKAATTKADSEANSFQMLPSLLLSALLLLIGL